MMILDDWFVILQGECHAHLPGVTGTLDQALAARSEEHTSELQSRLHLVCRLLLEKKKNRPPQSPRNHNPYHYRRPVDQSLTSPVPHLPVRVSCCPRSRSYCASRRRPHAANVACWLSDVATCGLVHCRLHRGCRTAGRGNELVILSPTSRRRTVLRHANVNLSCSSTAVSS